MLYDLSQIVFSIIASGIMFSLAIVVWVVICAGRMRLFQKAGVAGWKAWIPLYRDYVLCQITMGRGWYFLFGLIPFLMPLVRVIYAVEVTLSYGQNFLFGILYFFFPWICELIAGFGGSVYRGSQDLEGQFRAIFSGNPRDAFRGDSGPYTRTGYTQYTQYNGAQSAQNYGPAGGGYYAGPRDAGCGNDYGAPNYNGAETYRTPNTGTEAGCRTSSPDGSPGSGTDTQGAGNVKTNASAYAGENAQAQQNDADTAKAQPAGQAIDQQTGTKQSNAQ